MKRDDQFWIVDYFVKAMGLDALFPGQLPGRLERGFNYVDLEKTFNRIKGSRMIAKEWARTGAELVSRAGEFEEEGHFITAGELYYRAALCYLTAQWGIFEDDNPRKIEYHQALVDCFAKAIKYLNKPVERVEIPFEGTTIPAVLHLVAGKEKEKVPCILFVPGMDMTKENFPNLLHNHFAIRGMAVLSIDGPGQGESNLRKIRVTVDNYERAGKAAIDYLCTRPEIDPEKIGVYGVSMGSYWSFRIAATDERVKAVAGSQGTWGPKDLIFQKEQPNFRRNFMYMSGIHDDDEFDRMIEKMVLDELAPRIKCPALMATGEYDQFCPPEYAEAVFALLNCPKELWIFENEYHSMGGVLAEAYNMIADWLLDKIEGRYSPDLNRKRFIEARK